MYSKTFAFLNSLPYEQRRLTKTVYYNTSDECFCAIGMLFNYNELDTLKKKDLTAPISSLPRLALILEKEYGLTLSEAIALQKVNDGTHPIYERIEVSKSETPEERHYRVVCWLYEQALKEQAN